MNRKNIFLVPAFLLLLSVIISSCSTVAITGRKQLNIIPDATMLSMSFQQYDQFLKENKKSNDATKIQMINRVGSNIKGAVERYFAENKMSDRLNGFNWEFNLVESPEVNAWCMPGGKVVFYTGILPICNGEAGVAVVMGHEVAHAIAEHGSERMSQGLITEFGGMALDKALENKPQQTRTLWMSAFGLGAQLGVLLPFSRLHESEADHLGLIFMAMAGYDPNNAVDFWQRMSQQKGGQAPPEFLSTHPSDATRIAEIRKLLPSALKYYSK
ncbi:MAG: peptidase M48 [Ignavibacteriae bacterium HGW-Ignavibacteriae-2]|jgi:predicted Zn-dependent protease|nr:MAG: peptidase M48 [Ignavibacteriae bacterium HGW-Ignavibacteriae-2]